MHEVSLVADLVEAVTTRAGGRPVSLVRVRHSTTLPEDVLRQAFTMLTTGGPLARADLATQPFDVMLHCVCGFTGAAGHDDLVGGGLGICPACEAMVSLPPTAELELLEVRLVP